jgi:hypothetical protein
MEERTRSVSPRCPYLSVLPTGKNADWTMALFYCEWCLNVEIVWRHRRCAIWHPDNQTYYTRTLCTYS